MICPIFDFLTRSYASRARRIHIHTHSYNIYINIISYYNTYMHDIHPMKSHLLEFLDVLRDTNAVDVCKIRFVPTEEKCI